jgi:hypothetical protein
VNLNAVMRGTTLRQMRDAQQLWNDRPGANGTKFQEALGAGDYDAIAAVVAAKVGCTIDDALDLEIDVGDDADAEGETKGGTGAEPVSPLGSGG